MIDTLRLLEAAADSVVATACDANLTKFTDTQSVDRFEGKCYLLQHMGINVIVIYSNDGTAITGIVLTAAGETVERSI